jgi:hypothetical protein
VWRQMWLGGYSHYRDVVARPTRVRNET